MNRFLRQLNILPDVKELKKLSQSLAILDAILEPEWELRYYSFNSEWGEGEQLASMRDGGGSFYFIPFNSTGAIIKGFDRESPMGVYNKKNGIPWSGVLDSVPFEFQEFLSEPAFYVGEATFCMWRTYTDKRWHTGTIEFPEDEDPDGCERLLSILDGNPQTFQKWAEYYHERPLPFSSIEEIYNHRPLTRELVHSLNSDVDIEVLRKDIKEINYPN